MDRRRRRCCCNGKHFYDFRRVNDLLNFFTLSLCESPKNNLMVAKLVNSTRLNQNNVIVVTVSVMLVHTGVLFYSHRPQLQLNTPIQTNGRRNSACQTTNCYTQSLFSHTHTPSSFVFANLIWLSNSHFLGRYLHLLLLYLLHLLSPFPPVKDVLG